MGLEILLHLDPLLTPSTLSFSLLRINFLSRHRSAALGYMHLDVVSQQLILRLILRFFDRGLGEFLDGRELVRG